MRVRHPFARPPVCLAMFLSVCGWTAAPAPVPAAALHRYEQLCVLRADPRVRPSYVRPPAPRREPGANLTSAAATITVAYNGFTPEAQAAFQFAVNVWSA